jgi:hypothetical protein
MILACRLRSFEGRSCAWTGSRRARRWECLGWGFGLVWALDRNAPTVRAFFGAIWSPDLAGMPTKEPEKRGRRAAERHTLCGSRGAGLLIALHQRS